MSELPKGWVEIPLEKVATWGSGGTPKRSEPSYYGGDVPWVKTGDLGPRYLRVASEYISQLGLAKSSAKVFPKGSVAIAMYGATIGKTSILDFEASTNQACAVGNPIDGVILTDFLYYFLTSEKQNFIKKGKGGAQPNISQQLIKAHEIKLAPLAEQKRIVAKLDEVLAQVDTIKARLDRIPAILKRFRQSVLAAAVSGKLTEEWRLEQSLSAATELKELFQVRKDICSRIGKKDKELKRVTNSESKEEIPESWVYSTLDPFLDVERAGMKTGPFGSLLKKHEHLHEGVPVLGIENISSGTFVTGSKIYISEEKSEELSMYDIVGGDLIISRSGTVGDICVVPDNLGTLRFSTNLMRVSFLRNSIDSRYFCFLFLGSRYVLRQVSSLCKGSTRDFLNQKILGSIFYPVPPLAEQKEIVRLVDQYFAFADTIEAQVKKAQARVDNLTQSILAKAFRGELVPQNDDDEPAEVLLERIASARVEAETLAKTVKKVGRKVKATS